MDPRASKPSVEQVHALLTAPGERFEMAELRSDVVDAASTGDAPIRYWKNAPPDLPSVLRASAAHGDRTFLVYEDERLSFAQHFARAAALAHRLRDEHGVRPGDRVAIAMRNLPEWPIAFWAIAAAGGVVVPLNAWWTGPELAYGLGDSGSRVLIADGERLERLGPHLDTLRKGPLGVVLATRPDAAGPLPDGALPFEPTLQPAEPALQLPEVGVAPDDHATIFYTSGTTGRPKGVVGTHRNMCTNLWTDAFARARAMLRSGASREDVDRLEPAPAFLLSVPLFHVTGSHSILLSTTALGAKLVMMRRWNPERALELIERERITVFGGVPTMAWQVLESPAFGRTDTSSLRSVRYGGAPAPPELVRRIDEKLPGRMPSNGYGMTECSAIASSNAGDDYRERPDSVGVPVPVCDVRIVGEEGDDRPTGEVGELWLRGPNVARGYWNQPEATAETFGGGWLRTGDLARLDAEGFLYIVDRAKDVVIRGGENVYCAQVEQVLFEHPAVADAAVIAVPDRALGELVGAVIVRRPGSQISPDEIRDHVRARLAAYNVPTRVWIRDAPLPRNAAGKILKRALAEDPAVG